MFFIKLNPLNCDKKSVETVYTKTTMILLDEF